MSCLTTARLLAYAQGDLDQVERESVDMHLDHCRSCRCAVSEAARNRPSSKEIPSTLGTQRESDKGKEPCKDARGDSLKGHRLGRYLIGKTLGKGSAATVYEASDQELQRPIALKLMHKREREFEAAMVGERVVREGRAMARINHPNVVTVYEIGQEDEHVYVAMEKVVGSTLKEWLLQSRSRDDIAAVFAKIASGLQAIHQTGLLHRDLKPQNILMSVGDTPMIGDLGLAKEAETSEGHLYPGDSEILPELTLSGASVGTPAYMAPEILQGEAASEASDIYSLGVMYFEALARERLFEQQSLPSRIAAAKELPLSKIKSERDRRLLGQALAFAPQERNLTAQEFADRLCSSRSSLSPYLLLTGACALAVAGYFTTIFLFGASSEDKGSCLTEARQAGRTWDKYRETISQRFSESNSPLSMGAWQRVQYFAEKTAASLIEDKLFLCAQESSPAKERQENCLRDKAKIFELGLSGLSQGAISDLNYAPIMLSSINAISCSPLFKGEPRELRELEIYLSSGEDNKARSFAKNLSERLQPGSYLSLRVQVERIALARESSAQDRIARFKEKFVDAEKLGADDIRIDLWLRVALIASDELRDKKETKAAIAKAAAILERVDGTLQSERHRKLGRKLSVARAQFALLEYRSDDALEHLRKSLKGEESPFAKANSHQRMARALLQMGLPSQAMQELESSRVLLSEIVDHEHPVFIPILNSLIDAHSQLGQLAQAREVAEQARHLTEYSYGPQSREMGLILANMSNLEDLAEQPHAAISLGQKSIAILEKLGEPDNPTLANQKMNLAHSFAELGELERAGELFVEAGDAYTTAFGDKHVRVSFAEAGLAKVAAKMGDLDSAINHCRKALHIREGRVDPFLVLYTRFTLAQYLMADEQRAKALRLASQALASAPPVENQRQKLLVEELQAWIKAEQRK